MRQIITLLFVSYVLAGCAEKNDNNAISDIVLNDLKVLFDVVDYMYVNPPADEEVTKKIEGMIAGKLIGVRALDPDIEKLNGASLQGLCAAVVFLNREEFTRLVSNPEVTGVIRSYLEGIAPYVKVRADELKKTIFTDADCAI